MWISSFNQIYKKSFLLALAIKIKSTSIFKTALQVTRSSDIIHKFKNLNLKFNIRSSFSEVIQSQFGQRINTSLFLILFLFTHR